MMLGMAAQDPTVTGVRPNSLDDAPQLKINVDQDKAAALAPAPGPFHKGQPATCRTRSCHDEGDNTPAKNKIKKPREQIPANQETSISYSPKGRPTGCFDTQVPK